MPNYIVTDIDSDYVLENGQRYFMDFDVSNIPENEFRSHLSIDSISNRIVFEAEVRGHIMKNVKTEYIHGTLPDPDMVRIWFTPENALHIVILIAIGVAIIGSALLATSYVGGSLYILFVGLVKVLMELVRVPERIIVDAINNPVAVIAIIVVIAIFLLGRKL